MLRFGADLFDLIVARWSLFTHEKSKVIDEAIAFVQSLNWETENMTRIAAANLLSKSQTNPSFIVFARYSTRTGRTSSPSPWISPTRGCWLSLSSTTPT